MKYKIAKCRVQSASVIPVIKGKHSLLFVELKIVRLVSVYIRKV